MKGDFLEFPVPSLEGLGPEEAKLWHLIQEFLLRAPARGYYDFQIRPIKYLTLGLDQYIQNRELVRGQCWSLSCEFASWLRLTGVGAQVPQHLYSHNGFFRDLERFEYLPEPSAGEFGYSSQKRHYWVEVPLSGIIFGVDLTALQFSEYPIKVTRRDGFYRPRALYLERRRNRGLKSYSSSF